MSEELEKIEAVMGEKGRLELKLDMLLMATPGAVAAYNERLRRFRDQMIDEGLWDNAVRRTRLEAGFLP